MFKLGIITLVVAEAPSQSYNLQLPLVVFIYLLNTHALCRTDTSHPLIPQIAAHAPDAVDMEVVKEMGPIARHELAFKVAEERFDVHQLLEPSDTVNNPDEKSIMTYIAALTAKLPDLGVHVDVSFTFFSSAKLIFFGPSL